MEKQIRIGYENIQNKIGGGFKLAYLFIFCLSSRLPSLAFAAKISQLLHFVAKISHSHCSSIFATGFRICSMFIEFSMGFH